MSIDPRKWDMTCINQVREPDHPIPLVASYDKHGRLLKQAWVAEDLFYPGSSRVPMASIVANGMYQWLGWSRAE